MKTSSLHILGLLFCLNVCTASELLDNEKGEPKVNKIEQVSTQSCGSFSCKSVFSKMKKFARNGSPHAQAVVAIMLRSGQGTSVDKIKSVKFMRRAAKKGLSFAQYDLSLLYRTGKIVRKDPKKSKEWLLRAAKQGYHAAVRLAYKDHLISKLERDSYLGDIQLPKLEKGEQVLTVTRDKYTLGDLIASLESLGYGDRVRTGSRIKGQGCGNGFSKCVTWKINNTIGNSEFLTMISKINAMQTAIEMSQR